MKKGMMVLMLALLVAITLTGAAFAGRVNTMTWDAPTTNTNGTPLDDLAGYIVYCGLGDPYNGIVTNVGDTTSVPLENILPVADGMYYCVVTAVNVFDEESAPSNDAYTYEKGPGNFFVRTGIPNSPANARNENK